jgi:GH24 family phage-related lysozyme (muramidase)
VIHPAVARAFFSFSEQFEGYVLSPYLDVKGLVTVGVGNLIDPIGAALALPWKLPDGSLAPPAVVSEQWLRLKARQDLKRLHWKYAAGLTSIRLTTADVDALVAAKLMANADYMQTHYFQYWPDWPADAQLGVSSMAWACGPAFPTKFGNFTGFAKKQDWKNAGLCSAIRTEGNPGIIPRNKANLLLFNNAAFVHTQQLAVDVLHWPNDASFEPPTSSEELKKVAAERFSAAEQRARLLALKFDDIGIVRAEALQDLSAEDYPATGAKGGHGPDIA